MRTPIPVIVLTIALCVLVPIAMSEDSDADGVKDHGIYYCYSDSIDLVHEGNNDDAEWKIYEEIGGSEILVWEGTGARIESVDISGIHGTLRIEQRIEGGNPEVAIYRIIPLHLGQNDDGDGKHIVTFYDGDDVLETWEVKSTDPLMQVGTAHVHPTDPAKAGWDFAGWYTDPDCTDGNEFDPTEPIYGNMDVYAKWLPGGISLVTFDADEGLAYRVLSSDSNTVRFVVSVKDGYRFDMSTLRVTSTSGTLSEEADGTYALSGVVNDTTVTVTADRLYSLEYRLNGVTVSMDGYQTLPGLLPEGDVRLTVTADDGLTNLSIRVLKDGRDITSTAVDGTSVSIHVDGDIVITADARAPYMASSWWVVVMTVAVILLSLCIMSMPFKDDIVDWLHRNR